MTRRLAVVKLGGSVITDKRRDFAVRRGVLRRLALELASAERPLVVVHGGGSFGHPLASRYDIASGYVREEQLIGFSLVHHSMQRLNAYVIEALQRAGLPAVAIQPSACAIMEDGRIKSFELRPLRRMLELGIVPVSYGDAMSDLSRGMSILSGDQLAAYLARELRAERAIFGVDVDGVYTADPKVHKGAELIPEITPADLASIGGRISAGWDVTGGMANKVRELLALAEAGVEAEVVNASKPGVLKRAVLGVRGLGTRVRAGG